jgi:hypothetical protein
MLPPEIQTRIDSDIGAILAADPGDHPQADVEIESLRNIPGINTQRSEAGNRITVTATNGFRLAVTPMKTPEGIFWRFVQGGEHLGDRPLAGFHLRQLINKALNPKHKRAV